MENNFKKSFTQQEAIPQVGIDNAISVMQSGRLHRYNTLEGEDSVTSQLELLFSKWQGSKYCLACTSGGVAIQLALRSVGVKPGDNVLANAFTLAPVPGAIENVGANSILVEIDENFHINIADFTAKANASKSKFLLLSHMRGHITNMDKLVEICKSLKIQIIEDCAHTMGAKWDGKRSGNFGLVSAFSTQTYKHINSGEGGFLVTNDDEVIAKAIMHSGSYMLYEKHASSPNNDIFEKVKLKTANFSGRMDNLRSSILIPQLKDLDNKVIKWNNLYKELYDRLKTQDGIFIPNRDKREFYVGSSIQFRLKDFADKKIQDFIKNCKKRGVDLKWFGDKNPIAYTSRYDSWEYLENIPVLKNTLEILKTTLDMRIPLTFDNNDCRVIAEIIIEEFRKLKI
ncbi:MAG: DegT/DnrJ/EryC1/StrS family aminotransferase [Candidatus Puniceispirillales bacterium]